MSQEASHGAQPGPALRDEAGTQGSERGWELFPAQCGRQPGQPLAPDTGFRVHQERATASKPEGSTMTPKRQGGSPQHRLHPNQKNVCVGTRPHKDVLASAPTREANAADISDATSRLCPCVFLRGALPWSAMAGNTRTSPGRGAGALGTATRLQVRTHIL